MNLDDIRTLVLQTFFRWYEKAPTRFISSSEIVKVLKTTKDQTLAAIEFLEDEKYLKIKKTATGNKRYKISNKGLQEFAPSKFKTQPLSNLSVSTKGGIFVFGDNLGVIKQETVTSFDEINELIRLIKNSRLNELNKRQLIGDAETIKVQLTKPKPDKNILKSAWNSIKEISEINDAIELVKTIGEALAPFLR